jgi:hypothetical protein
MLTPSLALHSSYLGDIAIGHFSLEANYDRSSTIRGELRPAKIFRGEFLNLEVNFRGELF